MRQILSITRKELEGYFGSPLAMIFLGAFLAVELFIFFSVETFFARGIADVRPMFRWMPVLLIFLLAALTMRQWSEEMRSGTMEILLTLPVNLIKLVMGKFLAVMALIGIALLLTLPLPITTSILGNLDWGPVVGGYLAALLMAGAYAAIGLFVSSRTDNQIVALISTVLLGGLFYILGTRGLTDFLGGPLSELLWALGTGSRFESIERGVIDLRDLVYYLSLGGIFLTLNIFSLDSLRWSDQQVNYQRKLMLTVSLILINLVLVNVWLYPLQGLRLDLTASKEYTLSQVSKDLLRNLQEPLLIRGYISEKTHPLLAPLVPQIRDLLREYEIASGGKVTAEVVDPLEDPQIETEANQTYGIRPTPFQVAGRYEASVINSYFDILIRYGDQSEVLSFRDLIEVISSPQGVDVRLRNLEYDLTSSVKKVVFGFQSVDSILAELEQPVQLTLYETPQTLPEWLLQTEASMRSVAEEISTSSQGKLQFQVVNPDDPNSPVNRQVLIEQFGLQPVPIGLFSNETFYLHLVLQNADQAQVIFPSGEMSEAEIRTAIEAALKRTSTGFLKIIGLWTPPEIPTQDVFGQMQQPLSTFQLIREQLSQDYTVRSVDLSGGMVPADIDALVVVSPRGFTDVERFAIDQYLMRGGSVILAISNYSLVPDQLAGTLSLEPIADGVNEMLETYGVLVKSELVLDRQNMPFPVTVSRNVGGLQVQEIQAIDYPFFVDIRSDGMNLQSPILANVPAVTLNWGSSLELVQSDSETRQAEVLLNSSPLSWLRTNSDIQPNFQLYPEMGFPVEGEQQSHVMAVSVQDTFESFFKGKPSPLAVPANAAGESGLAEPTPEAAQSPVLESSLGNARLVIISSAEFVDDFVLELSSRISQDRYLNNLTFLQNAVDWSVEDLDLLSIRARGTYTRLLEPLEEGEQTTWEVVNYIVALAAVIGIYFYWRIRRQNEKPLELIPVSGDEK